MTAELVTTSATPPPAPMTSWSAADWEVSEATRQALLAAVPANTRRAYSRHLRDFGEWCDSRDRLALPATAETLTEYIREAKDLGKGVPTLRQAIAAIRSAHAAAGFPEQPPAYAARTIVRGHARDQAKEGVRVKQAPPIGRDELHRLVAVCDPTTLRGTRDRLLLVIGWGALLRRSEITGLREGDVRPCRDPADGLDVFISASKTDKESVGVTTTVPPGRDVLSHAPPMLADYLAARAEAGIVGGPLFRSLEVGGRIGPAITGDAIADLIKDLARQAGFPDWEDQSPHGLRSGGATAMYLAGKTLDQIIRQGRWADGSTVVLAYIREAERARNNGMAGVM